MTSDGDCSEHVYVVPLIVGSNTGAACGGWAFHCGRHGDYGPVRLGKTVGYAKAVADGQRHATVREGRLDAWLEEMRNG